jgi:hypothetical protein
LDPVSGLKISIRNNFAKYQDDKYLYGITEMKKDISRTEFLYLYWSLFDFGTTDEHMQLLFGMIKYTYDEFSTKETKDIKQSGFKRMGPSGTIINKVRNSGNRELITTSSSIDFSSFYEQNYENEFEFENIKSIENIVITEPILNDPDLDDEVNDENNENNENNEQNNEQKQENDHRSSMSSSRNSLSRTESNKNLSDTETKSSFQQNSLQDENNEIVQNEENEIVQKKPKKVVLSESEDEKNDEKNDENNEFNEPPEIELAYRNCGVAEVVDEEEELKATNSDKEDW